MSINLSPAVLDAYAIDREHAQRALLTSVQQSPDTIIELYEAFNGDPDESITFLVWASGKGII